MMIVSFRIGFEMAGHKYWLNEREHLLIVSSLRYFFSLSLLSFFFAIFFLRNLTPLSIILTGHRTPTTINSFCKFLFFYLASDEIFCLFENKCKEIQRMLWIWYCWEPKEMTTSCWIILFNIPITDALFLLLLSTQFHLRDNKKRCSQLMTLNSLLHVLRDGMTIHYQLQNAHSLTHPQSFADYFVLFLFLGFWWNRSCSEQLK